MMNPLFPDVHPLVFQWFSETYGAPTTIQKRAWEAIARGDHVLMTAPTGSGKTLAAFLWALNALITDRWSSGAARVLYVSPLKALNNDIRRNLIGPLHALKTRFEEEGIAFPQVRVLTRSGDTPASDRRRMLRQPPEILITTPESVNLLLSSAGGRGALGSLRTVILDEIHAVIGSRRGTYLITAVERLTRLAGEFQRIALSATVKPFETAARFVGGYRLTGSPEEPGYEPRAVVGIQADAAKQYALAIRQPEMPENVQDPKDYWEPYAACIRRHIRDNRSTLVFTNSRRLCEKLTYLLNRDQGGLLAYSHHGSLSKEIRTEVETSLKRGHLKAIVATSSLELGIDIGALDEVLLVQSPASVAEAMQRVGRAGHQVGEISRGAFYPSHAMDIVTAAVVLEAVGRADLEAIHPIAAPLDVLAQIILSMCAFETWRPGDLFNFIRTAYPYRELTRRRYDLVINLLEGRFENKRIRELRPRLVYDRMDQTLKTKKGALLALYMSGGVIPDRGHYTLRHADTGAKIGELDEEFVWEARVGQVFTLGTQNWRIRRITHSDVLVVSSGSKQSAPPFWRAEENSRGFHLSEKLGRFMETFQNRLGSKAFDQDLRHTYHMDDNTIHRLKGFLLRQQAHTGCALPHRHHLVIEFTTLGAGGAAGRQVVWHTLWGGRINRPLAMALEAAWDKRFGRAPQIFASNDGISFILPQPLSAEELLSLVSSDNAETLVRERLPQTGFFGARFRECAGRALLLPRRQINMRMPLWLSRLRAQKLLDNVSDMPDFPILVETWRSCLQDAFELSALKQLLKEVETGTIAWSQVKTAFPSPLAQNSAWLPINTSMYATDQPAAEQTGRLTTDLLYEITLEPSLRPQVDQALATSFENKRQRLAPGYAPDSAEDLLDWVKERIVVPMVEWQALLDAVERDHGLSADRLAAGLKGKLAACRSATGPTREDLVVAREMLPRWLSCFSRLSEKIGCFQLFSGNTIARASIVSDTNNEEDTNAQAAVLIGEWLRFYGPRSATFIATTLGVSEKALHPLLSELIDNQALIGGGLVRNGATDDVCDRENFEILLRMARKAAAPVFETLDADQLSLFLSHFQGVTAPGASFDHLARRLEGLMGWAAPAALWETDLLPARLSPYRSQWLDKMFQESDLRWVGAPNKKILFCFESELDLVLPDAPLTQTGETGDETPMNDLFPDGMARYPFSSLMRSTGLDPRALNEKIWEAVWRGSATNDTFSALRRGLETHFKMPDAVATPKGNAPSMHRQRRSSFQHWRGALPTLGNWFRLPGPAANDTVLDIEERNKERLRLLLDRYGILFRELLSHELPMLGWASLFRSLRLMELSGEIMSGQFFHGITGVQFISPMAYRLLCKPLPRDAIFWINAADPASVCGMRLDGLTQPLPRRLSTNHLVYHGTTLVVVSQRNGRHLQIHAPADHPSFIEYVSFLRHLLERPVQPLRRIVVETINNRPVGRQQAYLGVLSGLFETALDPKGVSLYRRHGGRS